MYGKSQGMSVLKALLSNLGIVQLLLHRIVLVHGILVGSHLDYEIRNMLGPIT